LFRNHYNIPLVHVDAEEMFMPGLAGLTTRGEAQVHRQDFIDVFDEEATKVGGADFPRPGHALSDVIESVSFTGGPSVTIKSHHNVGGLPERMNMQLVEPLRDCSRTRCASSGSELGLPSVRRPPPFPRPGLAIRIPGEVTRKRATSCARRRHLPRGDPQRRLYDAIWQAFAVLLPVKTVGVMGDGRTYDNVLALRAVTSTAE
jgi:GMP synthase (glutamine-hydrolysing)